MATRTFDNGSFPANLAVTAFRAGILSSNGGLTYATGAAGTVPDFIIEEDGASGDYVAVRWLNATGTQKCTISAASVTFGADLYWTGLGQVGITGTVTAGKCLLATTSNGAVIEFLAKTGAQN